MIMLAFFKHPLGVVVRGAGEHLTFGHQLEAGGFDFLLGDVFIHAVQGFGRGDHRVLINVMVPRRLSDEQRRLLDEFEQASSDDTYKPDDGFFDKLKSAFR